MGESELEVIEISPISLKMSGSKEEDEDGTPVRPVFCLKRNTDLKHFEETEDCFILDFDPFDSVDISKLSMSKTLDSADDANNDISVIAEKGQVACRDYPHSRDLCVKFPFDATSHESYCELCYCYVCDSAAPCIFWTEPEPAHCHAAEHIGDWKRKRSMTKQTINK